MFTGFKFGGLHGLMSTTIESTRDLSEYLGYGLVKFTLKIKT